jgi:hypothetical protein
MEMMMIAIMNLTLKKKVKNFFQPRKGRYKRSKEPSMEKMRGLASYLPNCF